MKGVHPLGLATHAMERTIHFRDPNFLQLGLCGLPEELEESHRAGRFEQRWTRWTRR